eukprot:6913254-Pyramimonas_sp.AAC.1
MPHLKARGRSSGGGETKLQTTRKGQEAEAGRKMALPARGCAACLARGLAALAPLESAVRPGRPALAAGALPDATAA